MNDIVKGLGPVKAPSAGVDKVSSESGPGNERMPEKKLLALVTTKLFPLMLPPVRPDWIVGI